MKYVICITIIWTTALSTTAQLNDDFQDGNIIQSPPWTGDVDSFVVNGDGWLQLNAQSKGTSSVFTEVSFPDSIIWEFDILMPFAPSSSNRVVILLMTSSTDFNTTSGYAIEIGQTGSPDPACFYAIENGQMQLLSCSEGLFNSGVSHSFHITYTMDGMWSVSCKDNFGAFQRILQLNESINQDSFRYFGLHCIYTMSRAQHFLFDNISISKKRRDTIQPTLMGHDVPNDSTLILHFNENISERSFAEAMQITPPLGANYLFELNNNILSINTQGKMKSGIQYTAIIRDIFDLSGNTMTDTVINFIYWDSRQPAPGDLIITEVLPDPTPPIGLPDQEYIEIYNLSDAPLHTDDVTIDIAGKRSFLPRSIIPPSAFAIIAESFDHWPQHDTDICISVPSLPSLRNSSGTIDFKRNDTLIHSMYYSDDLYTVHKMEADGRSLELIELTSPCALRHNWAPSLSLSGGTPGLANSHRAIIPVHDQPVEYYFISESRDTLDIYFDKLLSPQSKPDVETYPDRQISSTNIERGVFQIVFDKSLREHLDYSLTINGLRDCQNEVLTTIKIEVSPPGDEPIQAVINEILFDPMQGSPAFIEILNSSNQSVNTSQLAITGSFGTHPLTTRRTLPPHSTLAITSRPLTLASIYDDSEPRFIVQQDLKSPDRNGDLLILHTRNGVVLDSARYEESFHHPAIDDTKGVSLERISPLLNGNNRHSWQSASGLAGWATPGLFNSQSRDLAITTEGLFTIENDVFSPDGDGFEDELVVVFGHRASGMVARAYVADLTGQMIKTLSGHLLVGTSTALSWDGTDSSGKIRSPGLYLLLLEFIGDDGRSDYHRNPVVLAGGF